MSGPLRVLIAQTELGMEAEEFLRSDVGRYMVARAEMERDAAYTKLSKVSSWRRRRIQELQTEVYRAESFTGWLRELVNMGRGAASTYDQLMADAQDSPVEDRLDAHTATGERNDD